MQEGTFITIQSFMRTKLNLKGNELLVYAIIYGFSQDRRSVFSGSAKYLAEWIGIDKRNIYKILRSLCNKKLLIKINKEVNGVSLCDYVASLPSDETSGGVVMKRQGGSDETSPHNIEDNIKKNIEDSIFNFKEHKEASDTIATKDCSQNKKGTRLAEDWNPDKNLILFCNERGFKNNELFDLIANFKDYWTSLDGVKAKKRDWNATFRMWVRNANKYSNNTRRTFSRRDDIGDDGMNEISRHNMELLNKMNRDDEIRNNKTRKNTQIEDDF